MGEIIIRALLHKEIVGPLSVMVAETLADRRQVLGSLGVRVTGDSRELLPFADVILVCVKPQNAGAVLKPLKGHIPSETLMISIMAGIDEAYLIDLLGHELVVRSMPNLPARIGRGMTVWKPAAAVPDRLAVIAKMIFLAFGREVRVDDEDLLDAATAVSGTGPAYIFYIAENLLSAALELGFDPDQARKLVRETFRGAMDLWAATGESPDELRRKVTSRGGTTHAAVTVFEQKDVPTAFRAGVKGAYGRAKELAELAKNGR